MLQGFACLSCRTCGRRGCLGVAEGGRATHHVPGLCGSHRSSVRSRQCLPRTQGGCTRRAAVAHVATEAAQVRCNISPEAGMVVCIELQLHWCGK
eukprot:scaffold75059_cov22-Tisochrysis_lutea.AAC.2